ncbi:MAG: ABC transporter ATP-binding protein [Acidobacteria bacterium]|nr:MAG: ABC transporter ATP-binding protein [Acidobacteriota bacterium]
MAEMVIRTEGLTRDFQTTRAVDGLSIEVPRSAVFGFLGPNGSGKTTTIRMLLGLLEPTFGKVSVLGFNAASQSDEIRLRSGCLLEYSGLYERLSAEDNLELFGRIWKIPRLDRRARIQELLQAFGLWERRREAAGVWSRGMKQKLAVARALLHRPPLIFLDEPTAGLDPVAAAALREDLAALARREGVTVFLTTHNLPEAEKLCSRVAVIRRGKLLAEGSPEELRAQKAGHRAQVLGRGFSEQILAMAQARPEIRSARLENGQLLVEMQDHSPMAPLVSMLVGAGAEIEEIRKERASLEDVFLTLMEEDQQ